MPLHEVESWPSTVVDEWDAYFAITTATPRPPPQDDER